MWTSESQRQDLSSEPLSQDELLMIHSVFSHKDGGRIVDGEKCSCLPNCTEPLNKVWDEAREMKTVIP